MPRSVQLERLKFCERCKENVCRSNWSRHLLRKHKIISSQMAEPDQAQSDDVPKITLSPAVSNKSDESVTKENDKITLTTEELKVEVDKAVGWIYELAAEGVPFHVLEPTLIKVAPLLPLESRHATIFALQAAIHFSRKKLSSLGIIWQNRNKVTPPTEEGVETVGCSAGDDLGVNVIDLTASESAEDLKAIASHQQLSKTELMEKYTIKRKPGNGFRLPEVPVLKPPTIAAASGDVPLRPVCEPSTDAGPDKVSVGLVADDQGYSREDCVPDACSESDDASGNLSCGSDVVADTVAISNDSVVDQLGSVENQSTNNDDSLTSTETPSALQSSGNVNALDSSQTACSPKITDYAPLNIESVVLSDGCDYDFTELAGVEWTDVEQVINEDQLSTKQQSPVTLTVSHGTSTLTSSCSAVQLARTVKSSTASSASGRSQKMPAKVTSAAGESAAATESISTSAQPAERKVIQRRKTASPVGALKSSTVSSARGRCQNLPAKATSARKVTVSSSSTSTQPAARVVIRKLESPARANNKHAEGHRGWRRSATSAGLKHVIKHGSTPKRARTNANNSDKGRPLHQVSRTSLPYSDHRYASTWRPSQIHHYNPSRTSAERRPYWSAGYRIPRQPPRSVCDDEVRGAVKNLQDILKKDWCFNY